MQLAAMRARDPAAKALIFTQFSGTLAWLARRLQQEGYGYRTISGSMPLKKRAQVIMCFHLAAHMLWTILRMGVCWSFRPTNACQRICMHPWADPQ